jgi:hypothetical protein
MASGPTNERFGAMEKNAIEAGFEKLLRGLAHNSAEAIYSGHRALYRIGAAAIPEIERRIFQREWKAIARPEEVRFLTGLVNLLHDIDEARSRDVIDRLLENGCPPSIHGILRSVRRFDTNDFRVQAIRGLRVLESKEISENEHVAEHLDGWLENIPPHDLAGIERLYVIPHELHMDYSGQYMPILSTINLVWKPLYFSSAIFDRLHRLSIELTLYHEIGHHAHRHSFGQDPDQEREADQYAANVWKAAHPKLAMAAAPLQRLICPRKKYV